MKKYLTMITIAVILICSCVINSFAQENAQEVNALEYEYETPVSDDNPLGAENLMPESMLDEVEQVEILPYIPPVENPDTGVELAILPAAAALIVLIILFVSKKR